MTEAPVKTIASLWPATGIGAARQAKRTATQRTDRQCRDAVVREAMTDIRNLRDLWP